MSELDEAHRRGVKFTYWPLYGGWLELTPDEVRLLITDGHNAFLAKRYRVSAETVRQWKSAMRNGGLKCSAVTKKKRPCRNVLGVPLHPGLWESREVFCRVHGGLERNDVAWPDDLGVPLDPLWEHRKP